MGPPLFVSRAEFEAGTLSRCPGSYCGRDVPKDYNGSLEAIKCGLCPRGERSDGFICNFCDDNLDNYSILILLLYIIVVAYPIAAMSLRAYGAQAKKDQRKLLLTLAFELTLAIIATLLSIEPLGSFRIRSCGVDRVRDWYPVFYNPQPGGGDILHCANEAVFPLLSFVPLFDAYYAMTIATCRLGIGLWLPSHPQASTLGLRRGALLSLVALPAHAAVHVILGGLLFYSLPYLLMTLYLMIFIVQVAQLSAGDHRWSREPLQEATNIPLFSMLTVQTSLYCLVVLCLEALRQSYQAHHLAHLVWVILGPAILDVFYYFTERFTIPTRFAEE
eukprot:m.71061 g.71061  ORF g.71061 m.71061 type:complete len:332 (-) comp14187_c0_seq14:85-1080(-)